MPIHSGSAPGAVGWFWGGLTLLNLPIHSGSAVAVLDVLIELTEAMDCSSSLLSSFIFGAMGKPLLLPGILKRLIHCGVSGAAVAAGLILKLEKLLLELFKDDLLQAGVLDTLDAGSG